MKISFLLVFILLSFSVQANAGWSPFGNSGPCVGFGCDGEPIIGSDWAKKRWEEVGEAPASVSAICQKVGLQRCADPQFILVFQGLRAGAIGGIFDTVDSCAATGYTLNDFGHEGGNLVALAYGIPIPSELMKLAKNANEGNINAACGYIFDGNVNTDNMSVIKTDDGEQMYVEDKDAKTAKRRIKNA